MMTHIERKERRKEIAKMIENGATIKEMAGKFRVGIHVCRSACKEHGVAIINKVIPSTGNINILAKLMDKDLSLNSIAKEFNISKQRVQQIYKQAKDVNFSHLPIRTQGAKKKK